MASQWRSLANRPSLEAVIVNPRTISWDANRTGQVQDGGSDMYDGGNHITTSLCPSRIQPYSDNMDVVASNCFGTGGSYNIMTWSFATR